MKALRKFVDNIKPHFMPKRRFGMFHSTFDAFETFLFVPNKTTYTGSHIRDHIDMKRTMSTVLMALVPTLLFGIWNVGFQHFNASGQEVSFWEQVFFGFQKVFPIIAVTYITGLSIEFAFAQIRKHEVNEGFLVTGLLIPLVMPPDVPLWMVAVSTAFAVIIGKEVFGGTGMNLLNPALTARAFLFFAYPQEMSGDKVWIAEKADAYSGATPLAEAAAGNLELVKGQFTSMFWGTIPGSIGETSVVAIFIGALILIVTGVGSARIMLSVIAGGVITALLFNLWGHNEFMRLPFYYHLVMGGFAFGAVYMATDPVTAAQTNRGKIWYGVLIGVLTVLIRVLNPAFPEGMMLAILLMNVFAPLIDHYVVESNIQRRLKRLKSLTVKL